MNDHDRAARMQAILGQVRALACDYYTLCGKPLGVTGEIAEWAAAETLGLELVDARTPGHDAIRRLPNGLVERIQIKGRAFAGTKTSGQRIGLLKRGAACDKVLLVILDNATLEPREMWEASYAAVSERLGKPGSKARTRGALGIDEFKCLPATKIWPTSETAPRAPAVSENATIGKP